MAKGLERARELYANRGLRAKELRDEGNKVMGYICCFPPVELITAAGLVPYRITGSQEPITEADAYLETLMCPFVRSCFDLGIRNRYSFVDGVIWPHSCDNVEKTYDVWKHYIKHSFYYYLDVPHMVDPSSFEFFTGQLEALKSSLEKFSEVEISEQRLRDAIDIHNQNRALLRNLSGFRKQDPPLISGSEMTQVMVASTTIPADECNQLLREINEEVEGRTDGPAKRGARLLVYGCEIDDIAFIRLVEKSGANVVIDDLCFGTRDYWRDVATEGSPIRNLAEHYLGEVKCPRTYLRSPGTRQQDLDNRFGHIRDFAKEYDVDGAILYIIQYCDTFEFDAPDVRDYLEQAGVRVLHLEDDYVLSNVGGVETRIQAFLEVIGNV